MKKYHSNNNLIINIKYSAHIFFIKLFITNCLIKNFHTLQLRKTPKVVDKDKGVKIFTPLSIFKI